MRMYDVLTHIHTHKHKPFSQRKPYGAGKGTDLPQKPGNRSSQIMPHLPPGCDSAFSPT